MRGRAAEARRQLERASEIDPLSVIVATMRGFQRDLARDFAGSEREYRKALELDPHHFLGHWGMRPGAPAPPPLRGGGGGARAGGGGWRTRRSPGRCWRAAWPWPAASGRGTRGAAGARGPARAYVSPYQRATVHEALGERRRRSAAWRRPASRATPGSSGSTSIPCSTACAASRASPPVRARVMGSCRQLSRFRTISVRSSVALAPAAKASIASRIAACRPGASRSRRFVSSSTRRASPNSSSCALKVSVTPSEKTISESLRPELGHALRRRGRSRRGRAPCRPRPASRPRPSRGPASAGCGRRSRRSGGPSAAPGGP